MKSKKRNLILIAIILFILILGVAYFSWRANRISGNEAFMPKLAFVSAQITNISDTQIDLNTSALILSNFPFDINADRFVFKIYFDSLLLIKNELKDGFRINALDSTVVFIPLKVKRDSIKEFLGYINQNPDVDSIDIRIVSELKIKLPIIGIRNYEFENIKRIAPIRMPSIQLDKVELNKFGLKQSILRLHLVVKNVNKKDIKLLNTRYRFLVDGQKAISGDIDDVHLPAKGRDSVVAELDIKTLDLGKLGWKYLFDKENTNFNLQLKANLVLDQKSVTDSVLSISVDGTMKELKDAVNYFSGKKDE